MTLLGHCTEHHLAFFLLENTGKLPSALHCSSRVLTQQVPNGLHLLITPSQSRTHDVCAAKRSCGCVLCILDHRCLSTDATMELLDCSLSLSIILYPRIPPKLGLMLQAINEKWIHPLNQSDHSICYNYDLI